MLLSVLSPTLRVPTAVGRRRISGAIREVNSGSQRVALAVVNWLAIVRGDDGDLLVGVGVVERKAGGRLAEVEEAVVSVVGGVEEV